MAKKIIEIAKINREMALPSGYNFESTILIEKNCFIGFTNYNTGYGKSIVISFLTIAIRRYIQYISSKCSMC